MDTQDRINVQLQKYLTDIHKDGMNLATKELYEHSEELSIVIEFMVNSGYDLIYVNEFCLIFFNGCETDMVEADSIAKRFVGLLQEERITKMSKLSKAKRKYGPSFIDMENVSGIIKEYVRTSHGNIQFVVEFMENTGYELINFDEDELVFYDGQGDFVTINYDDVDKQFSHLVTKEPSRDDMNQWAIKEMESMEFMFLAVLANGLLFRRLIDEMDYSFTRFEQVKDEYEANIARRNSQDII